MQSARDTTATHVARPAEGDLARGAGTLVLDRYRLCRRLGAGGFGVVWLAHDEHLDRAVAVKRIGVEDPAVAARAEREAIAAARLAHPGIVALYEAGRDENAVYLVSELVRGRTLADLIDDGALSDRDVLRIGVVLCDALAHAHARGVIHRDVKPPNIIVPEDSTWPHHPSGIAKLTDFGIARMIGDDALTRTGDVVGTLAYMAPEQAEGREVGAPADLYALALVIYEGLAGVNPVRGRGAASTARRVGARLPPLGRLRRDLPLNLCEALDAAVRPRPDERGTLRELRVALAGALPRADDEPGTVAGPHLHPGVLDDVAPRPRCAPGARVCAAVPAAALTAAALLWLGPAPPVPPEVGAAVAAGVVLLLPRLGWTAVALAVVVWLAASAAGVALLVALAVVPVTLLLRDAPPVARCLPAVAPALGALGLGPASCALAGQVSRPLHRAALGALGLWWLVLAEPLTGERLLLGAAPGTGPRVAWEGSAGGAFEHVISPLLTSGALAVAALWAVMAVLLPVLVRGRAAAFDVVAATAWAAGLAAGTQAIAGALAWDGGAPSARGATAGAILAAALAVGANAARGSSRPQP